MIDNIPTLQPDNKRTYVFSGENRTGEPGGGSKGGPNDKLHAYDAVKPGEVYTLVDTDGPGVVSNIWIGGEVDWNMIIRFYWDGCEEPAVECPLCSFFGYGYCPIEDENHEFPLLNSAMVMVGPCRGFNCYWQMPFNKHCKITMENRNNRDMLVFYSITVTKQALPQDIAYFHAEYRQEMPHVANTEYVIIDGIEGKGYFAGVSLSVGTNGHNGCWVEGEAKMFIDDDKYPSINYTGTEDYFCGSFAFDYDVVGKYSKYCGLYAGMFYADICNPSKYAYQPRFMLYRWHVLDPVYFTKTFKMTLQDLPTRYDDFSSVAYWYQDKPGGKRKPLPSAYDIAKH